MAVPDRQPGRLAAPYTSVGSSSFVDLLADSAPQLLPGRRALPPGGVPELPHATTIVAFTYADGVLMAGDRRATAGNLIAQRDVVKVFPADGSSIIGFAGTAGLAIELTRLFQVELEHYEKLNGDPLTLDGKANRLAAMVRGNLGMAMQGLVVLPLFAGFDHERDQLADGSAAEDALAPAPPVTDWAQLRPGRIFSFDPAGGHYEERDYDGIGSGSLFAKAALKKRWSPDLPLDAALRVAVDALYDAADDDSATGGPDLSRRLFPTVVTATAAGAAAVEEAVVVAVAEDVVAARRDNPGG